MNKKYKIIYCDPCWSYRDKMHSGQRGVEYKYPTMSIQDICNLPVNEIADENCFLFIWITPPQLPNLFKVLDSWGFEFKTKAFNWVKLNKNCKEFNWNLENSEECNKKFFIGGGSYSRANSEDCYLAVKGKPKRVSASVRQIIMSPRGEHSAKPPEIRDRIVELCGDLPRIELFAREKVDGWSALGNDIDGRDIRESMKDLRNNLNWDLAYQILGRQVAVDEIKQDLTEEILDEYGF